MYSTQTTNHLYLFIYYVRVCFVVLIFTSQASMLYKSKKPHTDAQRYVAVGQKLNTLAIFSWYLCLLPVSLTCFT